jgi:hypothetical protein
MFGHNMEICVRPSERFLPKSSQRLSLKFRIVLFSKFSVRLIKMCLTETYSRIRVGKNLSEMYPIRNGLKQGDAISPLLFNFGVCH